MYSPSSYPSLDTHGQGTASAMASPHRVDVVVYVTKERPARQTYTADTNLSDIIARRFDPSDGGRKGSVARRRNITDLQAEPNVIFDLDFATLRALGRRYLFSTAHFVGRRYARRSGRYKEPAIGDVRFPEENTVQFSAEIKSQSHHMDVTGPNGVERVDRSLFSLLRDQRGLRADDCNRRPSRTRDKARHERLNVVSVLQATTHIDQLKMDKRRAWRSHVNCQYAWVRNMQRTSRVLPEPSRRSDRGKC